jgi:hypothetical protein
MAAGSPVQGVGYLTLTPKEYLILYESAYGCVSTEYPQKFFASTHSDKYRPNTRGIVKLVFDKKDDEY